MTASVAREQLAEWAQREVERGIAHKRDYLVRHLTAHLGGPTRAAVYARLLVDMRWLQRKLELTDVNTLLSEFSYAPREPTLAAIELALRQSAHILRRHDGLVDGPAQLASQLLARLLHRTEVPIRTFCADVVAVANTLSGCVR